MELYKEGYHSGSFEPESQKATLDDVRKWLSDRGLVAVPEKHLKSALIHIDRLDQDPCVDVSVNLTYAADELDQAMIKSAGEQQ